MSIYIVKLRTTAGYTSVKVDAEDELEACSTATRPYKRYNEVVYVTSVKKDYSFEWSMVTILVVTGVLLYLTL